MAKKIVYCVQYDCNPLGKREWADTRHGDQFTDLATAERFRDDWDLGTAVRIVKRTEEVVPNSVREGTGFRG